MDSDLVIHYLVSWNASKRSTDSQRKEKYPGTHKEVSKSPTLVRAIRRFFLGGSVPSCSEDTEDVDGWEGKENEEGIGSLSPSTLAAGVRGGSLLFFGFGVPEASPSTLLMTGKECCCAMDCIWSARC